MNGVPLVSLQAVSFSYPLPGGESRRALRGVSLEVLPGERLVILGANGAGKSTLALVVAGVLVPTAGEVSRFPPPSEDSPTLPAGLVTQNPEDCFSTPLVREEMGVVLENLERDPSAVDHAVDEMLAEVGLAGHATAHPARLSGGQKQLLALASVLIAEPPLLVLDEPLSLLDAPSRTEVDRLLARPRGPGAASVFLTSEVEDAGRGTRVIVLHEGAVAWEGPPAGLPRDAGTLGKWGLLPPAPGVAVPPASRRAPGAGPGVNPSGDHVQPFIEITDLHFSYDLGTPRERAVLRGVDLVARPGELLCIAGANGSGKTTLIQHLNGLLLPQRGRVRVGGRTLEPGTRLRELLHREVGLVFQFPEKQLFAETVDEDVAAGLEFAAVPEEGIPVRVRTVLERVGLDPGDCGARAPQWRT